MIDFQKKIQKESSALRLRVRERVELRERIESFMAYHPLREVQRVKVAEWTISFSDFVSLWQTRLACASIALIAFVGLPAAAERAVPGDVLYAMKVNVNEEVYAQLSFSSYERVVWETRRVERRIAEARLLAQEGRLTADIETQIGETVKKHTQEAQRGIEEMREGDSAQAAVAQVELESALDVQKVVLEATEEKVQHSSGILALAITDAKASVVKADEHSEKPTLPALIASLETNTTRARDLFSSIAGAVTEQEKSDIERRFADLERRAVPLVAPVAHASSGASESVSATATTTEEVSLATTTHQTLSDEERMRLLRETLKDVQKLIVFMTDIDVRASVALEKLLPKVLTEEERRALMLTEYTTLKEQIAMVRRRIAGENPQKASVDEKLIAILTEAERTLIPLEGGEGLDISEIERSHKEARAYVTDLLEMTDGWREKEGVPLEAEADAGEESQDSASSTEQNLPTEDDIPQQ